LRRYANVDAVSRRSELLKLEGLSFSQAEIVKDTSMSMGIGPWASGDVTSKTPFFRVVIK
jgi:hypothetical protein